MAKAVEDVPAYEAVKDMAVGVFNHKQEMSMPILWTLEKLRMGKKENAMLGGEGRWRKIALTKARRMTRRIAPGVEWEERMLLLTVAVVGGPYS